MSFPGSSASKESACNAGDPGLIPGSRRSAKEQIGYPFQYSWVSLSGSAGKESACNARDLGSIIGWEDPWRREWLCTPGFWPGEFHGLYSPWGYKESDMTKWFSLSLSLYKPPCFAEIHGPPVSPTSYSYLSWQSKHKLWNGSREIQSCLWRRLHFW